MFVERVVLAYNFANLHRARVARGHGSPRPFPPAERAFLVGARQASGRGLSEKQSFSWIFPVTTDALL